MYLGLQAAEGVKSLPDLSLAQMPCQIRRPTRTQQARKYGLLNQMSVQVQGQKMPALGSSQVSVDLAATVADELLEQAARVAGLLEMALEARGWLCARVCRHRHK